MIKGIDGITGPLGRIGNGISNFGHRTSQRIGAITSRLTSLKSLLLTGAIAMGINRIWQGFEKWVQVVGEIEDLAFQIGITTDTLQRYQFAAKLSGVSTDGMSKSVGIMSRQMGQAHMHTGKLYGELSKRAPGLLRQALATKSNTEALDLFMKALDQTTDPAERAALAQTIFGKSGAEMVRFVKDGYKGLKSLTDEAESYGLVTDEAIPQVAEFGDNLDRLKYAAAGFGNILGAKVTPLLNNLIKGVISWIQANRELIAQKITDFVGKVYRSLVSISAWVGEHKEDIKTAFTTGLDAITALSSAIAGVFGWIKEAIGASAAWSIAFGVAVGTMAGNPNLALLAATIAAIVAGLKYIDQQQMDDQDRRAGEKAGAPKVFRNKEERDAWIAKEERDRNVIRTEREFEASHSIVPDPNKATENAFFNSTGPRAAAAGMYGFSISEAPGVGREVEVPIRLIVNSDKLPDFLGVKTEKEIKRTVNTGVRMQGGIRH